MWLTRVLAVLILIAPALLLAGAPTTLNDFHMPGSQPNQSGNLESVDKCDNCHGGYDLDVEPAFKWRGSMMSQAMRDPEYRATMSIANQDAPESGDLCLRCHTPRGWLGGRSTPTDGSALSSSDYEGIDCDFCHRLVRPTELGVNPYPDDSVYTAGTYTADQDYIDGLPEPTFHTADGMYEVDSDNAKRGPFLDAVPKHQFFYSPFHSEAYICATCHDVSNPVFTRNPQGKYEPNDFDTPAPDDDPYTLFPVERTFSEWRMSAYNSAQGIYAPQFGGNKDTVRTCQDCHMRDVTGVGANKSGVPTRDDLPLHDMTGGNTLMPILVNQLYPGDVDSAALWDGIERARSMLQKAASMNASATPQTTTFLVDVEITNETGHKLPSGYPEGRRIWINVRAYNNAQQLIYESGAYDSTTAVLTHDADVKIYQIKPGISTTLAPVVGEDAGPSFHFVLNDSIYSDNRIPPRGFTNAAFDSIQSPPVAYSYADGQYWDNTAYVVPGSAARVEVTLFYQTTSKEYADFLLDENETDDWGTTFHGLWQANGMSAPEVMVADTLLLIPLSTDDPPTAICPSDTSTDNDPGDCGAVVTFAVSVDDDNPGATVSANPPSGSFFNIGTTPVEVIAIDTAGQADTCYFNVTVTDNEPPAAICPADTTVDNDTGECGAVVEFTVSATNNCPGATVSANPASGSLFPVGVTGVEVVTTDSSGLADTCYFNVTVTDNEPPVAICPEDINQPADPGETGSLVEFTISSTDNCPGQTVAATPPSGSFFSIGQTPVEVIATDAVGLADTCQFQVTVTGDDTDGDGVPDTEDNCPLAYNPGQDDTDSDTFGDSCDICAGFDDRIDTDGDSVPDGCDVCPGFDDLSDGDFDGIPDSCDNCPEDFNPGQEDSDHDEIGDACDGGCCLPPTVGDIDQSGEVDITDISVLIDNQFLTLAPLVCDAEGDLDFSGEVDITDLSILIDNQFLTLTPLPPCP